MISDKMDVSKIMLFVVLLGAFYSSTGQKGRDENVYKEKFPLPGVVPVDGQLLCDKIEVSNVSWREYVYWTKRIFGEGSKQDQTTMPDQTVWTAADTCLIDYELFYFTHPMYNGYPVMGITQHQAKEYSKWRTDRVLERMLIKMKMIREVEQDSSNYFTVEKYFTGKMGDRVISEKKIWYYAEYRLPTMAERERILHMSDSLYASARHRKADKPTESYMNIYCDFEACVKGFGKAERYYSIIQPGYLGTPPDKRLPILNLRGNAGEWLEEEGVAAGGGWKDKRERILESDTFNIGEPNAWTGFRNICEWKKWGE